MADAIAPSSQAGEFVYAVWAAFAKRERQQAGERTASALRLKRERGEKTGGNVPLGYRVRKRTVNGRIVKHLVGVPKEQKLIAKIKRKDYFSLLRSLVV